MNEPNEPQLTFQTLQLDCLLEILQYVPLPECMFLRSSSKHLKTAVDEHFRTSVRELPVVLSGRYSPQNAALQEENCELSKDTKRYEKIAYGSTSGVSQLVMYDDKVEDYEVPFRSESYLVLFDLTKFGGFVNFITQYLPGVTKLALIIDHEDHMNHVPEVLNLYRKQLKVLLLERTARSVLEYNPEYDDCNSEGFLSSAYTFSKGTHFSEELYHSIDGLEVLEELHFFPKEQNIQRFSSVGRLEKRHFVKRMLQKLKVLHFRSDYLPFSNPTEQIELDQFITTENQQPVVFENLERLICNDATMEIWREASFPRLETLSLDEGSVDELEPNNMPSLKTLRMVDLVILYDNTMKTFNDLLKLERCRIWMLRLFEVPIIVNKSIKFLEIDLLEKSPRVTYSDEETLEQLIECLRGFQGLEKVIVREPFMELTERDLRQVSHYERFRFYPNFRTSGCPYL